MAERYFDLTPTDRAELLELAASQSGRPAHLLEKDIWVVWALNALFSSSLGSSITFKGGTTLSKVYGVIDRFSEDIDLTYDIRALLPDMVTNGTAVPPNASQARKWTETVRKRLPDWLRADVQPILESALAAAGLDASIELSGAGEDTLLLNYEAQRVGTGYVAPRVVLEFGARSTGEPATIHHVTCDLARWQTEIACPEAHPRVLSIRRTFWEKATAAHVYCQQTKLRGDRYSRHWYDLAAIQASNHFDEALNDRLIATAVADHKTLFFAEKDTHGTKIDYHAAVQGHLNIVPRDHARSALEVDYAKMIADGLLVDALDFSSLMKSIHELEQKANAAARSAIERPGE